MRAVIQRVSSACVRVDGAITGSIDKGLLVLLGVAPADTEASAEQLWEKLKGLRIFNDAAGKMNLSLIDVGGSVLVVSQFTLFANCSHGRRPSFTEAASPHDANYLYEYFCSLVRNDLGSVEHGIFGAHMDVELTNEGPVTIWLDTDEL